MVVAASLTLLASTLVTLPASGSRGTFRPSVKTIEVMQGDDTRKTGTTHGVMGHQFFRMAPGKSGISDQLRFEFSAPAEIVAVDVSVDVSDRRARLVEFAVGVNNTVGYGFSRSADWLMHVSWVGHGKTSRHFDETVRLPRGVEVDSGDFVGVGAWISAAGGGDLVSVSPEVVLLYRWLD